MTDIQSQNPPLFTKEEILDQADRVLFVNSFIVAYEEPIDVPSEDTGNRGYLMAFVHNVWAEPSCERVQFMSGDDEMIRRYFSEMASDGVSRIQKFIEE